MIDKEEGTVRTNWLRSLGEDWWSVIIGLILIGLVVSGLLPAVPW